MLCFLILIIFRMLFLDYLQTRWQTEKKKRAYQIDTVLLSTSLGTAQIQFPISLFSSDPQEELPSNVPISSMEQPKPSLSTSPLDPLESLPKTKHCPVEAPWLALIRHTAVHDRAAPIAFDMCSLSLERGDTHGRPGSTKQSHARSLQALSYFIFTSTLEVLIL